MGRVYGPVLTETPATTRPAPPHSVSYRRPGRERPSGPMRTTRHRVPRSAYPEWLNRTRLAQTNHRDVSPERFGQLIALVDVADLTPWQARQLTDHAAARITPVPPDPAATPIVHPGMHTPAQPINYLRTQNLADLLRVTRGTVYRMIRDGRFPNARRLVPSGDWLIPAADVRAFIAAGGE